MNEYSTYEMHELTYVVIGAAMEVHKTLGPGFLERVYEEALSHEFDLRGIPYQQQHPVGLNYKGKTVGEGYLDFLSNKRLILELKSVDRLHPIHTAQCISYLKTTGLELCLLLNFNVSVLRDGLKRVALSS